MARLIVVGMLLIGVGIVPPARAELEQVELAASFTELDEIPEECDLCSGDPVFIQRDGRDLKAIAHIRAYGYVPNPLADALRRPRWQQRVAAYLAQETPLLFERAQTGDRR